MKKNPHRQYCLIDGKYTARLYAFDDDGDRLFQTHEEGPLFKVPAKLSVELLSPIEGKSDLSLISYEEAVDHFETISRMREQARPKKFPELGDDLS